MHPISSPLIELGEAFKARGMEPPTLTVCDETWFRLVGELTPLLTHRSDAKLPDDTMMIAGLRIERQSAHQKKSTLA